MENDFDIEKPFLTKAIFSGLFTGLIVALAALAYDFGYRAITGFQPSELINVASIIFVSVLLPVVSGVIYFFLVRYFKMGYLFYIMLFLLLIALAIYGDFNFNRSVDAHVSAQFRWLFLGIIVILGFSDVVLLPYFAKHTKYFL